MYRFLFLLLFLPILAFSNTATQTDWSGGSGVPGPVTDWGNSYDVADIVDDTGSSIQLEFGFLSSQTHVVNSSFAGASSIYAADVDGDGDIDVLGTADEDDDITWWENTDGTGSSWIEHTVDGDFDGASSVCATDFDGDGDIDVLGGSGASDGVYLWENTDGTGTSWADQRVDVNSNIVNVSTVIATDFDGDTRTDVVAANSGSAGVIWYELIPAGWNWMYINNSSFTVSIYASDVDGDGDQDLLGARSYTVAQDEITWWENTDGAGTSWTEHTVGANYEGAASVYGADIDGDGDIDVLGAAEEQYDITWWENADGTGLSWTEHVIEGDFDQARAVCAADVDNDGDMDVLGLSSYAGNGFILMWENTDGTGTSWTEHIVDGYLNEGNSLFTADVNGNGYIDVLSARSGYDGRLDWYDLIGYSTGGTLESSILDAGTVDSWETVAFTGDEPAGTSVGIQFRSSDDYASMGTWSDTVFTSGASLSGILPDSTDFLQYRVILETSDVSYTPVLNDITLTYSTYVSIGESSTDVLTGWGLIPVANPMFGNCAVRVSVPQPEMVDLILHDITGRVIAQYSQELPVGMHAVSFSNIAEGVYFCTMHAGDFTATERVVVLK